MKKYLKVNPNGNKITHIKVETSYSLGGMNLFTYRNEPRGYYLHVSPVERSERYGCIMESFIAFSGIKKLLKGVSRKSAKAEREADEIAAREESELIRYICEKSGVTLSDEPDAVTA